MHFVDYVEKSKIAEVGPKRSEDPRVAILFALVLFMAMHGFE